MARKYFDTKMVIMVDSVEHFTPSIEQLEPFQQLTCSQPRCAKVFSNQANYQMHLEKHHRLNVTLSSEQSPCIRLFYCPGNNCAYWYGKKKGKHFKNMKLLRQHYQKVHMAKRYECEECPKAFATEGQLRKHKSDVCGKTFACRDCGWSYNSMEALMTHGKRRGHNVRDVLMINKTKEVDVAVPKGRETVTKEDAGATVVQEEYQNHLSLKEMKQEISVQTVEDFSANGVASIVRPSLCSSQMSASVQTDLFPEMHDSANNPDLSHTLDDIETLLRDIATQTESSTFAASNNDSPNYLDQMLAQSHMYTQTCDDFLSELGLADIQTQTHWPSPERDEEKLQYTSTATSTNPFIHDELLVSTETQTSFTQCLLNSCNEADTVGAPAVSFSGLHHTQHTQTCGEPLLENFDLMDGFQSTYTQT